MTKRRFFAAIVALACAIATASCIFGPKQDDPANSGSSVDSGTPDGSVGPGDTRTDVPLPPADTLPTDATADAVPPDAIVPPDAPVDTTSDTSDSIGEGGGDADAAETVDDAGSVDAKAE